MSFKQKTAISEYPVFKPIKEGERFEKDSFFMNAEGRVESNVIHGKGTVAKEDGYYFPFEDLEKIPREEQ